MSDNKVKSNFPKILLFIIILIVLLCIILFFVTLYKKEYNKKNSTIDININSENVNISVDALIWNNKVTKKDLLDSKINYSNNLNQLPDSLSQISTAGGVYDGKMNMFYVVPSDIEEDTYNISSIKENEVHCTGDNECKDKHFIAFDVFFKTEEAKTLYIGKNSIVDVRNDSNDDNLINALRVGFVIEGIIPYNSSKERAQKLNGGTYSIIWEPNYDIHDEKGLENAKKIYGFEIDKETDKPLLYQGINTSFENKISIKDINENPYFTSVNPSIKTKKKMENNERLVELSAGITKMRVYIWLEGQDVDMEINKLTSDIKLDIELITEN